MPQWFPWAGYMRPTCLCAHGYHLCCLIPASGILNPIFKTFLFVCLCVWAHAPYVRMLTETGRWHWRCEHLTCIDTRSPNLYPCLFCVKEGRVAIVEVRGQLVGISSFFYHVGPEKWTQSSCMVITAIICWVFFLALILLAIIQHFNCTFCFYSCLFTALFSQSHHCASCL